jgi:hypothetical protein
MNTVLLDIWSDLREKRLWPVAVALLAGVVAVPVLLAKPAEEAQPAPVVSTADSAPATAQLLPADLEAAKPLLQTSTLSEFDTKDPFKPLRALEKIEDAAGVASTEETGGGSSETTETADGDTGGTTVGGDDTGESAPPPVSEEKTVYTYQAVVQLGTPNGSSRRTLNRLGILPSASNPMLVFLGVSADDRDEAVFLVDSTVSQAGEGRCKPSVGTCSFLYLKTSDDQNEHIFTTDDGGEYTIELLKVRRVKVDSVASSASDEADDDATDADVAPVANTAVGATGEPEPVEDGLTGFGFPLFADEEE